jgi:DNA-binding transcriptional LysR family regulator
MQTSTMNDLDLNDIRAFVAVGQVSTVAPAVRQLHLPASTVSRALTRLEKRLGVLLVQRSPKGLILTDSGKEYLQSCRRVLQTLKHGRELLEERRSVQAGSSNAHAHIWPLGPVAASPHQPKDAC